MAYYHLRDLVQGFFPAAPPPQDAYAGKTVCITGSTTGSGRAAALHFLQLGAEEVIITCRSAARGTEAKAFIESKLGAPNTSGLGPDASKGRETYGKLTVMELDLLQWGSIQQFAADLKKVRAGKGGIDCIVLNAAVIQTRFTLSPTGW